jgi:hypothetical protein
MGWRNLRDHAVCVQDAGRLHFPLDGIRKGVVKKPRDPLCPSATDFIARVWASPLPSYPGTMLAAEASGEVLAQFVFDAHRHVDTSSVRIIGFSQREFISGVRRAIGRWTGVPGQALIAFAVRRSNLRAAPLGTDCARQVESARSWRAAPVRRFLLVRRPTSFWRGTHSAARRA